MSPARLCLEPHCPDRAHHRGRCKAHARQREQQTNRVGKRIYNSARWKNTRKRVLFEQPLCECGAIATDVHHKVDLADGGDPWSRGNLEALCHSCHSKETWSRRDWGPDYIADVSPSDLPRLVVICGRAGSGKSEVRKLVAKALGARSAGPDDVQGDWRKVYDRIDVGVRAVVECVALPRALRARVKKWPSLVVLLEATDEVRAERLLARGESPATVDEWLSNPISLGYEDTVTVHLRCRTDGASPEDVAARILLFMRDGGGSTSPGVV